MFYILKQQIKISQLNHPYTKNSPPICIQFPPLPDYYVFLFHSLSVSLFLFVPLYSPAVSALLFYHTCPAPTFLIVLNIHIFLPLSSSISAPALPSRLHSFYSCYTPTLWHPRRLCFLPALSSSALLVNTCPLCLSQDHDAPKALLLTLLSSPPTLCEVLSPLLSLLPQLTQGPCPHVALQTQEITLLYSLLYFIHPLL